MQETQVCVLWRVLHVLRAYPPLRWGDNGLIASQFLDFIELLDGGKQVEYQGNLKLVDLVNFDPFQKIRIDGDEFVMAELEADLGQGRRETCPTKIRLNS